MNLSIYDKIIDQGILFGFIAFETPRLACYLHPTDVYDVKKGWLTEPRHVLVIGETEDSYVTKLVESEHGEWTNERILYKYILPIGFHKSRFSHWEETQLSLF